MAQYDAHVKQMARADERSKRLMDMPGIGATTASALLASIGNGHDFNAGRQLAAWLGLVPRQYSSGGKQRLGRITKAGDPYLRTLLILGARAVLANAKNKTDRMSRWQPVCRSVAATGVRWWPLRPRMRACAGRCWPKAKTSSWPHEALGAANDVLTNGSRRTRNAFLSAA